jgi:hypothetical protein
MSCLTGSPNRRAVPPLEEILEPAIEATAREDGWSPLAGVGSTIGKTHPSFDSRNYGFSTLGELVRNQAFLEVSQVPPGNVSRNELVTRKRGGARRGNKRLP